MAKIKDINGDGKRDFRDTWLGEKLLGGGKTKGPNLKESMAGARRESSAAPMKSAAPKAKPSTKATTPKTSPKPMAKPKPVTKDGMAGYRKGDVTTSTLPKVETKPSNPMPSRNMSPTPDKGPGVTNSPRTRARMGNVTKAEYDAMTPAQRKAKGLPLTWTDRIFSPSSNFKPSKNPFTRSSAYDTTPTGMAKGGMVSKKGKC